MRDDFRIGLALEHAAAGFEFLPQWTEVLDDPVVHQREFAGGVRVRVVGGRRAVSRPTGVGNADRTGSGMPLDLQNEVDQLAFRAAANQRSIIDRAQPCAVIAAIFHPPEAVDQALHNRLFADDTDDSAHGQVFRLENVGNADTGHLRRKILGVACNQDTAADQRGRQNYRIGRSQPRTIATQGGCAIGNLRIDLIHRKTRQEDFGVTKVVHRALRHDFDPDHAADPGPITAAAGTPDLCLSGRITGERIDHDARVKSEAAHVQFDLRAGGYFPASMSR